MSDQPSQPNPGLSQDVVRKYDEELVNPPASNETSPISAADLKAGLPLLRIGGNGPASDREPEIGAEPGATVTGSDT